MPPRRTGWSSTSPNVERQVEQVRSELLGWLRRERLEPPAGVRLLRIVRSALDRGEKLLIDRIRSDLDSDTRLRLNELVFGVPDEPDADPDGPGSRDVLAWVKTDPGRRSLNTMLAEIGKLQAIRTIRLAAVLMAQVVPKVVTGWRVRTAVLSPIHFWDAPAETRWVALSALLEERQWEITEIAVTHRAGRAGEFTRRGTDVVDRLIEFAVMPCCCNVAPSATT